MDENLEKEYLYSRLKVSVSINVSHHVVSIYEILPCIHEYCKDL